MITASSRYAQSTVVVINDPVSGQDRPTIVPGIQEPFSFNFNTYQTTSFDRIDSLAYSFYGDQNAWHRIADANPQILDWSNIPAATILRIPFV